MYIYVEKRELGECWRNVEEKICMIAWAAMYDTLF